MKLHNWYVRTAPGTDFYTPPELLTICLAGVIDDDPPEGFTVGQQVCTAGIDRERSLRLRADGRENCIATMDGLTWELGEPEREFVEWCRANKRHIPTPREPIQFDKPEPAHA